MRHFCEILTPDGPSDVMLDRNSDGGSVDYLNGFGVDDKLRQTNGAATHYYLQDHQGSTVALTDTTGSVAERQSYEPFGGTSGSALTRYGYTGRELDAATGLMYYRARWYDPQQARFITQDLSNRAGDQAGGGCGFDCGQLGQRFLRSQSGGSGGGNRERGRRGGNRS